MSLAEEKLDSAPPPPCRHAQGARNAHVHLASCTRMASGSSEAARCRVHGTCRRVRAPTITCQCPCIQLPFPLHPLATARPSAMASAMHHANSGPETTIFLAIGARDLGPKPDNHDSNNDQGSQKQVPKTGPLGGTEK